MAIPEKFLLEEDDGLPTRKSNQYALYKLKAVATYLEMVCIAMRQKPWRARYYIDLQAGPGKNRIETSIVLGSPLNSLMVKHGFTHYRFNDSNPELVDALRQRVQASPQKHRVEVFQDDLNQVVHKICDEIDTLDNDDTHGDAWSSLNIAFLDPEGLELKWATVERLARVRKMDLIINFSTGGLLRSIGAGYQDVVDEFFGTPDWRTAYDIGRDATSNRRALIDFYLARLPQFGYIDIKEDPDHIKGSDIAFKNKKNKQVYSLIFASKNDLGDKFWGEATKSSAPQPKLPGFD